MKTLTPPKTKTQTTTVEIPAGIYRLAKQLEKDPKGLATRIMRAGIEAIDDTIGNNYEADFDPIAFSLIQCGYGYSSYFTITGIIERMPPDELADCQQEADQCDQALQEIVCERAKRCVDLIELQE